jgi:hypothetical protein
MFDWDRDQESLLSKASSQDAAPVGRGSGNPGLRGKLGTGFLVIALVTAFAYEKDFLTEMRVASVLGLTLFDNSFASTPTAVAVPDGLLAYDNVQARSYMQGLRLADSATLQGYAAHLSTDIALSGPALAPFLRDARTLVLQELTRRSASAS